MLKRRKAPHVLHADSRSAQWRRAIFCLVNCSSPSLSRVDLLSLQEPEGLSPIPPTTLACEGLWRPGRGAGARRP